MMGAFIGNFVIKIQVSLLVTKFIKSIFHRVAWRNGQLFRQTHLAQLHQDFLERELKKWEFHFGCYVEKRK